MPISCAGVLTCPARYVSNRLTQKLRSCSPKAGSASVNTLCRNLLFARTVPSPWADSFVGSDIAQHLSHLFEPRADQRCNLPRDRLLLEQRQIQPFACGAGDTTFLRTVATGIHRSAH